MRNNYTNLNKARWVVGRMLMVALCVVLASTQIYAQTGVTIGDTSISGNSMLNVKGNLAVGSTYYTTAAPTNGMIVEGNVGIGSTSTTLDKLIVNATGSLNGLRVQINGTTKLFLQNNGGLSVGSSTASASDGLYVTGDARLNSRLSIGAGPLGSTSAFVETPTGNDMLRMRVNTFTKFLSAANGGTSIGSGTGAPTDGLYVQGAVQFNTLASSLSTNLVTSDGSGNLTKYAHGTSGQFLRGDGWQNITTIIPTGTVNQTLRHDGTNWVASNTILNLGTGAAVYGTTPDFTVGDQTDGSRGFKIGYTPSGSGSTASIISLQVRHTGAVMNWLKPMSFNDLTGTIGMGLTIGGSGFTAPIPTSQLLVSTDVPTAAQDGVGRFIFNGTGNNGTSYYGLTAVSDPTTSGAKGVGVLASGDYYGLMATNPIGSTPAGAILSEGNIDVTTGNVTVSSGNITENGNAVMRWRGVLATAPATDVQEGDMYFNSTSSDVFIRANGGWINLTPP